MKMSSQGPISMSSVTPDTSMYSRSSVAVTVSRNTTLNCSEMAQYVKFMLNSEKYVILTKSSNSCETCVLHKNACDAHFPASGRYWCCGGKKVAFFVPVDCAKVIFLAESGRRRIRLCLGNITRSAPRSVSYFWIWLIGTLLTQLFSPYL